MPIIISILVYIIIRTGKYFYYFTEIAGIILVLIFMWVYPNFIQPLFNTFKELEEGELKKGIFALAKRVNYPLTKIYEKDESKRSAHSNAYLFGFWKNKRIVLFDTLIKNLQNKEIESCLAHELGHWSNWHSLILLFIAFTNFFILFYLLQFFINETAIFVSFGFEQKSVFIGLYLFFQIYSPFTFFINILQNSIVRRLEYQADKYAYELGYGDTIIKALSKLSERNKSGLDADPLYSLVNNSHPILIERIRAINKYKDENKKEN
jgi:STE24 endopeptidase